MFKCFEDGRAELQRVTFRHNRAISHRDFHSNSPSPQPKLKPRFPTNFMKKVSMRVHCITVPISHEWSDLREKTRWPKSCSWSPSTPEWSYFHPTLTHHQVRHDSLKRKFWKLLSLAKGVRTLNEPDTSQNERIFVTISTEKAVLRWLRSRLISAVHMNFQRYPNRSFWTCTTKFPLRYKRFGVFQGPMVQGNSGEGTIRVSLSHSVKSDTFPA